MRAETREPIDYLAEFRERATLCREVISLLTVQAGANDGCPCLPHIPQMIDAIDYLRGLSEDEIEHFGEWRYHELQHDQILDFIDEEIDRVGAWVCRMAGAEI